ncbi:MAG TPA: aminotransferase class I/II-fold pyridoxal phosphate-dependent enzyme [Acidobacteriota bacterium]
MTETAPLRDLPPEQMEQMLRAAEQYVLEFLRQLPTAPMDGTARGAELAEQVSMPAWPKQGRDFFQLMEVISEQIIPPAYSAAGGGYLAYIPGGGVFPAAVANLIADVTNRYVGVWTPAPAAVQVEVDVIDWFRQMIGYPESARGTLTSGGSIANLTAVICGRAALGEYFQDGVVYTSSQVHHSAERAARQAGFPASSVVELPVDSRFRIDMTALERRIAQDRKQGKRPALIIASAGTTNTGAVDSLADLAELARREEIWLHVDGAYGGFFMLTERGRRALAGIEASDSVTLDPHKGLFLPYGTGSIVVRDGQRLKQAMEVEADYLQDLSFDERRINLHEYSLELSRDFRGLRVWLPLVMFGREAYRATLDEKLDMTAWLYERLRGLKELTFLEEPQLSILAFTARDNDRSRHLMRRVNESQQVLLSSTMINGRYVVRICILNFRTDWPLIHRLAALIEQAVREIGR